MSYYGYRYERRCHIPAGTKCPPPAFPQQCHPPGGGMKCVQCPPPRAPAGAKVCSVRKSPQSPPCSSGCVETHVAENHRSSSSSSCCCCCCCSSPRSPNLFTTTFPQPQGQGREQLCVSQCVRRCPQVGCAPAPLYPHGSLPYSYQWSNSYQYNCGQQ